MAASCMSWDFTGHDPSMKNGKWQPTSMSLDTIRNSNPESRAFLRDAHNIHDIDGAVPRKARNMRKPDLHSTLDIKGAQSRVLHSSSGRRPNSFSTADIEGAQPIAHNWHSGRCTDPLDPAYKLPSSAQRSSYEPRFLRDSMNFSDIPGNKPAKLHKWKQRDLYNVSDIPGTTSSWKPTHKRRPHGTKHNPMDVSDITRNEFKTRRQSNPLKPVYKLYGAEVCDSARAQPRPLMKAHATPFFSLATQDIAGATAGIDRFRHLRDVDRRHYRSTNLTQDIAGGVADSLKHGIVTKRQINPLAPTYTYLDGGSKPGMPSSGRRTASTAAMQPSASEPVLSARSVTLAPLGSNATAGDVVAAQRPAAATPAAALLETATPAAAVREPASGARETRSQRPPRVPKLNGVGGSRGATPELRSESLARGHANPHNEDHLHGESGLVPDATGFEEGDAANKAAFYAHRNEDDHIKGWGQWSGAKPSTADGGAAKLSETLGSTDYDHGATIVTTTTPAAALRSGGKGPTPRQIAKAQREAADAKAMVANLPDEFVGVGSSAMFPNSGANSVRSERSR